MVGRQLAEAELQQYPVAIPDREAVNFHAKFNHPLSHAQTCQRLQSVCVDDTGTRCVLTLFQLVDQQMSDAGLMQTDRERHASWASADDDDVRTIGKHFNSLLGLRLR